MIVCVCTAMSACTVRQRIESGARTLGELARETVVMTDCGTCRATILEMLHDEERHANYQESQLTLIAQMGVENYLALQVGEAEEAK